jgi:multidrug efflux pump subunit AcrB
VLVQKQARFRQRIGNLMNLYVGSSTGAMVPLQGLVTVSTVRGPDAVNAYDLFPAVLIDGAAARGKSSGCEQTGRFHEDYRPDRTRAARAAEGGFRPGSLPRRKS